MKPLTEKNQTIIKLLSEGKTIKEVADTLKMKHITVRKRIEKMRKEYSCANTVQLVFKLLHPG